MIHWNRLSAGIPTAKEKTVASIDYAMDGNVAVVTMDSGENRFNLNYLSMFQQALDRIEKETAANVLVVKSAHEKIWSNGIDLEWMRSPETAASPETGKKFSMEMNNLMKRILVYPMITIAAINGHAFAGGAIMSCTFDFRFMRSDRGFFCFPEIDLRIPFTPFLNAIVKKAIPMYKLEELQLTGKRATAEELQAHHIVVKACPIDTLMNEVMAFARTFNKNRETVRTMKTRLHEPILRVLEEQQNTMD